VQYEIESFLDKNKDQLYPDLVEMLSTSALPLVRTLFTDPKDVDRSRAAKGTGARGAAHNKVRVFRYWCRCVVVCVLVLSIRVLHMCMYVHVYIYT